MTAKAITVTSLAADTMQKVIGATVAKADLTTKEFGVTQVKKDTTVWAYIDHRVKVATIQREFSETALRAGR